MSVVQSLFESDDDDDDDYELYIVSTSSSCTCLEDVEVSLISK